MGEPEVIHHYFVDEAGDTTLFSKRGRVLVGTEGCSSVFMLGLAHIPDPDGVTQKLDQLRMELLSDPYFKNVPSMQLEEKKTAIAFHAKNDLPEVRREVFKLIATLGVQVFVAIRRKSNLAEIGIKARQHGAKAMIGPDQIYDDLVKRILKHRLHIADRNSIVFARRGKSARIAALASAIERAKTNFAKQHAAHAKDIPTDIEALYPSQCASLQVVDYYLWAIQRMYERGEDRFFDLLRPDYRLIMDLDDHRRKPYGEWYDSRNQLTLQKMKAL
jgi:hypothetical protein